MILEQLGARQVRAAKVSAERNLLKEKLLHFLVAESLMTIVWKKRKEEYLT